MNMLLIFIGIGLLLQYLHDLWWLRGQRLGCVLSPYIYVMAMLAVCILSAALLGPLLLIRYILAHLGLVNYTFEIVLAMSRSWLTTSSVLLLCAVAYHRMKTHYGFSHYGHNDYKDSNLELRRWMLISLLILLLPVVIVVLITATNLFAEQAQYFHSFSSHGWRIMCGYIYGCPQDRVPHATLDFTDHGETEEKSSPSPCHQSGKT